MYIQKFTRNNKGKISTSVFLVESYREGGKQKRRTIANLSKVPKKHIEEFKKVLKGGKVTNVEDLALSQGKSIGALFVLDKIADQIGIKQALGNSKMGKLALLQILNKIICPSSRLGILKDWVPYQAVQEVLKLESFSLDDLYMNLEWLCQEQQKIEDRLFKTQNKECGTIYLYDVTSSYFEGQHNELAAYGYNRDGKKAKKQLVIGLLTDANGDPFSVEVFQGNTCDTKTFGSQLEKLKQRFGVKKVVCVGDKGMIKSTQINQIQEIDFHYITSITSIQIRSLLSKEVLQLSLFDTDLVEVEVETQGIRYILRKNPVRKQEMETTRVEKLAKITAKVAAQNEYLQAHPRAKVATALKKIQNWIIKLKLHKYSSCIEKEGVLCLVIDQIKQKEVSKLDGCYVIKTDLSKQDASKEIVHQRYKDLIKVEYAFRTLKTTLIELRPLFLRKQKRTRGHVFACMLAYKIVKAVMDKFNNKDCFTKKHIINSLNKIQYIEYNYKDMCIKRVPDQLLQTQKEILETLNIKIPKYV